MLKVTERRRLREDAQYNFWTLIIIYTSATNLERRTNFGSGKPQERNYGHRINFT